MQGTFGCPTWGGVKVQSRLSAEEGGKQRNVVGGGLCTALRANGKNRVKIGGSKRRPGDRHTKQVLLMGGD